MDLVNGLNIIVNTLELDMKRYAILENNFYVRRQSECLNFNSEKNFEIG